VALGDRSMWDGTGQIDLDPVVFEGLKSMTLLVNHNNTIAAGHDKDTVVGILLALHDHHYRLDADEIQGWALANGWRGGNPQKLADYIRDINNGKRPRTRSGIRSDYIEHLRKRATGEEDD
jgi:hypothetical protein